MSSRPLTPHDVHLLMSEYPLASPLLESMSAFYGDRLLFIDNDEQDGPVGGIRFDFHPSSTGNLELKCVRVSIKTQHPRAPISLIHELLHLELRTRGYPLRHTNPESSSAREDLLSLHDGAWNVLDHYLFKDQFRQIGLPVQEIVPNPAVNRTELLKSWVESFRHCAEVDVAARQWAYYAYFVGWMTERILETLGEVDACCSVIEPCLPDLKAEMSWLPDWFQRGAFIAPEGYRLAFWEALAKMRIPRHPLYKLEKMSQTISAREP